VERQYQGANLVCGVEEGFLISGAHSLPARLRAPSRNCCRAKLQSSGEVPPEINGGSASPKTMSIPEGARSLGGKAAYVSNALRTTRSTLVLKRSAHDQHGYRAVLVTETVLSIV
jgi:hypothetical protein